MNPVIYDEFMMYFEKENKEKAIPYVLDLLKNQKIDVIELYVNLLTPALNNLSCPKEEEKISIWKEHIKTAIVRTIVECAYPYVMEKKNEIHKEWKGTAVVLCPPEEYHDLGARMVTDFLTICGYETIFVGSNTPQLDFYHAISMIKPAIIAISVSNYYNIVVTKKMIQQIKDKVDYKPAIIVGGNAFNYDSNKYKVVDADYFARTYEDLVEITGQIKGGNYETRI